MILYNEFDKKCAIMSQSLLTPNYVCHDLFQSVFDSIIEF
jgi:hypothetical protein